MKGTWGAHIALWIVQIMYGVNYVVAKGLMPKVIGPNGFILLRVAGAALLFWTVLLMKFEKVSKKDLGRLALCALFGVALNQLMFFNGLMRTSPVNAPVIMTTTPIIVLILAAIFLKEKIKWIQLVGIILGAVGCIAFILSNTDKGFASSEGDLLIFLNASSYSVYLVLVKPLMKKYKPLTVITWVFTFGLIYVLLWIPTTQEIYEVQWESIESTAILQILFVIIGVTFIPYLLNVVALKSVSPSIAAVYIYLQPILATSFVYFYALAGWTDYSSDMTLAKIMAALVVFTGVYLVIRPPQFRKSSL